MQLLSITGGLSLFLCLSTAIELCDGAGYDLGEPAYFYLEDPILATETNCGKHCRADTDCKAFAVGNGACLHYDTSVANNARGDEDSPWKFFDRSCVMIVVSSDVVVTSTDPAYISIPTYAVVDEVVAATPLTTSTVSDLAVTSNPSQPQQTSEGQSNASSDSNTSSSKSISTPSTTSIPPLPISNSPTSNPSPSSTSSTQDSSSSRSMHAEMPVSLLSLISILILAFK